MIFPPELLTRATDLIAACRARGAKLSTAESCTGGLVMALLTEIPGSSDVVERGFITYSNGAKATLLGVSTDLLRRHGAVSEAVARAMAEGALARAPVDLTVAITGIAGPGGGNAEKPVGLVHIASAAGDRATLHERHLFGDIGRGPVRMASVAAALALLEHQLS